MEVVAVRGKELDYCLPSKQAGRLRYLGLTTGSGNLARDDTALYTGVLPYASLGLTSLNIGTKPMVRVRLK